MHFLPPLQLRNHEQVYNTIFMGERSHDVGGPYRESFEAYCEELQSEALPLLVRCQNNVHKVGQNRDQWVVNPGAQSPTHFQMFAFLGKLMGIAIRTKGYLQLNLSTFVWKLIVGDTPTIGI